MTYTMLVHCKLARGKKKQSESVYNLVVICESRHQVKKKNNKVCFLDVLNLVKTISTIFTGFLYLDKKSRIVGFFILAY